MHKHSLKTPKQILLWLWACKSRKDPVAFQRKLSWQQTGHSVSSSLVPHSHDVTPSVEIAALALIPYVTSQEDWTHFEFCCSADHRGQSQLSYVPTAYKRS